MLAVRCVEGCGNGEGALARAARHLGEIGPAQPPAGREERERLDQIGLADAVVADERNEPPRHGKIERRIGAEILKDEAGKAGRAGPLSLDGRGLG
jgi:hypothetical protein